MQENNPEVPVTPVQTNENVKPIQVKKTFPVLTLVLVVVLIFSLAGTAYLAYQNMQLRKEIAAIKASPTPVVAVDPTTGWKTYMDTIDKIEFKYPQNWDIQPNGGITPLSQSQVFLDDHSFEVPTGVEFLTPIEIRFSTAETKIEDSVKRLKEGVYGPDVKEIDNLSIGGNKAIQLAGKAGPGPLEGQFMKRTFIQLNNKVLEVELNDKIFELIYDQILPTFKFSDETSIGSICKSTNLGLSLNLPNKNWNCVVDNFGKNEKGWDGSINLKSLLFTINISSLGRGLYCEPTRDPLCIKTNFFTNSLLNIDLYKYQGENKEFFGQIVNGPSVSISYVDMNKRDLIESEKQELISLFNSISKY